MLEGAFSVHAMDWHTIEGVGTFIRFASVDGNLAANQEDEKCDCSPEYLLLLQHSANVYSFWPACLFYTCKVHRTNLEGDLTIRLRDFGKHM